MSRRLPVINIVDVNNLLHIGNHRFRNYSIKDVNGFEIKTGGMYMVMNLLRRKIYHPTSNIWVFCFDRKSHRRELGASLGIEYKTGRSKMPAHLMVQADELREWLPKIGYNTLAVDGLEADDLIATIVQDLKDQPVHVNILSTDRDHAFNVSDKCHVVSSNSKVPSVTRENYEGVVGKKGHYVEFNTILLYKVICGDDSDGVPAISRESYGLYKAVCKKLKDMGIDLSELGNFDLLEKCLEVLDGDLREKALVNWQIIKPFMLDREHLNLQRQEIDKEVLYEFCSIFGMKSIAKKFDIELGEYPESVMKYRLGLHKRTTELESPEDYLSDGEDSEPLPEDNRSAVERINLLKEQKDGLNDITLTGNGESETSKQISEGIEVTD